MIVISDTSPLLYLFLIDLIELLPQLYGQIIIPEVIRDEMIDVGAPTDFRNWAMEPPSWLTVISVTVEPNVNLSRLDPGEQAAIFLAQSLKADLILIDERLGRQAAIGEGLEITGILGILDEAAEKNLIDIRLAITQLQQTNFRVSPQLVKQLLDHHLHP